ncbi:hypothetical protein D9M68_464470 [compost metagenome]
MHLRRRHGQLVTIRRFATDADALELELAQAPDAGGEVTDKDVHRAGGQGLECGCDAGIALQAEVGMPVAQQLVGGVVGHDADAQAVEVLDLRRLGAPGAGKDDDGEVEVGAREVQVLLALGGGHDAGQDIQFACAGALEHIRPIVGLDGGDFQVQPLTDHFDIVGGQALVTALGIAELEGGPGGVYAQSQFAMLVEPGPLFRGERQGPGRNGPECQPKRQ